MNQWLGRSWRGPATRSSTFACRARAIARASATSRADKTPNNQRLPSRPAAFVFVDGQPSAPSASSCRHPFVRTAGGVERRRRRRRLGAGRCPRALDFVNPVMGGRRHGTSASPAHSLGGDGRHRRAAVRGPGQLCRNNTSPDCHGQSTPLRPVIGSTRYRGGDGQWCPGQWTGADGYFSNPGARASGARSHAHLCA